MNLRYILKIQLILFFDIIIRSDELDGGGQPKPYLDKLAINISGLAVSVLVNIKYIGYKI
jgi:hypothetical protein